MSFPSWSPDGHTIAYAQAAPGATAYFVVSAIGGHRRQIAQIPGNGSGGLDWFAEGKRLVISQMPEGARSSPLLILDVDSGEQHVLTHPPAGSVGDLSPSVSPDGKMLAFVRMKSSDSGDIYLMSIDNGYVRRLTFDNARLGGLAWMPDGGEIIFSSARNGTYALWRITLASGMVRPVMPGVERTFWPAVSRDGKRLAYMASTYSDSLWRTGLPMLRHSSKSVPKRVIASTRTQGDPQHSPDGKKIAFSSSRSGSDEIWISDVSGSTAVQLTSLGYAHTGSPTWSPDGSHIAFDSRPKGDPDIFVIRADGGAPRRITSNRSEDVTPNWSHDGKWIYFASDRTGEFQIWKTTVAGESAAGAIQVTHGGGFAPMESRDGKQLYFAKGLGKPGLWRLALYDSATGEEPVVESLQHWGWWTLADQGIYFLTAQALGSSGIFFDVNPPPKEKVALNFLNLATGIRSRVAMLDRPVSTCNRVLTVAPKGDDLIYEQLDREDADIMMVENFAANRN